MEPRGIRIDLSEPVGEALSRILEERGLAIASRDLIDGAYELVNLVRAAKAEGWSPDSRLEAALVALDAGVAADWTRIEAAVGPEVDRS